VLNKFLPLGKYVAQKMADAVIAKDREKNK